MLHVKRIHVYVISRVNSDYSRCCFHARIVNIKRVAMSDDSKKYIVKAVLFYSVILSVKSADTN